MIVRQPLPIDPALPEIAVELARSGALVLVAEPGAGKTTRVPPALLEAGAAAGGEILILEPRRLAARLAARRVAEELGEEVGGQVGYQVRFEDLSGPRTVIRFVTEAILTRRLVADPHLTGVGTVILDEFHERSLHSDLALAAVAFLRRTSRPDLKILVMSATLEAEPVAEFLLAPVLRVPGRVHPLDLEHETRPDDRPLPQRVAAAARRIVAEEGEGDILVFLPGASEIRRSLSALADDACRAGLLVVPLHGDLPPIEQDAAIRPADHRKVILATNVAESSITIEGVRCVIDSGLFRQAGHSPWSGMPILETLPISQASAAQRAGRAARTGPGRCIRLFTRFDLDHRPAFTTPEIRRADLAELMLTLAAVPWLPSNEFRWFDPLPQVAVDAARGLLRRLGAIEADGGITTLGRRMLRFPVHPRAARLLLAAADAGAGPGGALLAAILSDRDLRLAARTAFHDAGRPGAAAGTSDLIDQWERFLAVQNRNMDSGAAQRAGLDPGAVQRVGRSFEQLRRLLDLPRRFGKPSAAEEQVLLQATLAAFPDRVGRLRGTGSREVVFAGGGAGTLSPSSVVGGGDFLVAVEAEEQRGRGVVIRQASRVAPEWLFDAFPERIEERTDTRFDPVQERVEVTSGLYFDGLPLEENRRSDVLGPAVTAALVQAVRDRGWGSICEPDQLAALRARRSFAAEAEPSIPLLDDETLGEALRQLCEARRSLRDLREADFLGWIEAGLSPALRAALERLAPRQIALPNGRTIKVHYEAGRPPWAGSYLQDFFGLGDTPRLLGGRLSLVLELWAPSRRPVQVTSDLASFWRTHYPALRRQLMRRYPRHFWPENPLAAEAR